MSGLPDLDAAFPAPLAPLGRTLGLDRGDAVPLPELLSAGGLAAVSHRYAAGFPGADGRAVLSLWSQYYLLRLVPCAAALALAAGRDVPISLHGMGAVLSPAGEPERLALPHAGCPCRAACPVARLTPLLREHLDPLAAALAGAGLPPRVFWSNAGAALAWSLSVLSLPDPARAALLAALSAPCWEDRGANPLRGAMRPCAGGVVRSVCCLRFRLPGVATCPDCPRGRN